MMKLNSLNKVSLKFIIPSKRKLEENPYLLEFVPSNCSRILVLCSLKVVSDHFMRAVASSFSKTLASQC